MLYLIKSYGPKGKLEPIYKVGYTSSIENRLNQYFGHNPFIELISVREGDEELETLIHACLYSLGYRFQRDGRLNEWFIGNLSEIQYIFHSTKKYLEKVVWRNRDKAFSVDDINIRSDSFKLLRRLYKENNYRINSNKYIIKDDNVVIKTNTSDLDISFYKILLRHFPEDIDIKDAFPDISIELEKEIQDFLDNKFYKTGIFEKKMKMYCEFMDEHKGSKEISDIIYFRIKDPKYYKYYKFFGTKGCRAVNYEEKKLNKEIINVSKSSTLQNIIYSRFKCGERYTSKDLKEILREIYQDLGISRSPKANDLGQYFKLTKTNITNQESKKLENGFRLDPLEG